MRVSITRIRAWLGGLEIRVEIRFWVEVFESDLRKSDLLLSCSRSPTLSPMPASCIDLAPASVHGNNFPRAVMSWRYGQSLRKTACRRSSICSA